MILKISFYFYIFLILILACNSYYFTYNQYLLWKIDPISQYLLPPHQSINYFIQYSFYRFWSHFLAALIFSLMILFLAKYFNKKRNYQYFENEEPYFIAIAILIVGYPGWLVYFSLILLSPILFAVCHLLFARKVQRLSYYYLWLMLAIIAIILNKWLATFVFWHKLTI